MRSLLAMLRTLVLPFGTVTGTRIILDGVNGRIDIYNAANQLISRIDGSGYHLYDGADEISLIDSAGIIVKNTTGAYVQLVLDPDRALVDMFPPPQVGHTYLSGAVVAESYPGGPTALALISTSVDGGAAGFVRLYGASGPAPDQTTQLACFVDHIRHNGNAIGGALVQYSVDPADSAGVTAEAIVLTLGSYTYKKGHGYRLVIGPAVSSGTALTEARFRVRKTNLAGQVLYDSAGIACRAAGTAYEARLGGEFQVDPGADVTASLVLTLSNLGAGNTVTHRAFTTNRYFYVQDAGDSEQYAFGPTLS